MRVLLADDHPLFVDGLRNLLVLRGFEVVGVAADGLEAVAKARTLHPDIILMDIRMPRLDGLAAMRAIKAELPDIRIVILTMVADDENIFAAIRSGASGYLLKTQDTNEVFRLLSDVAHGEAALSPGLASRILREFGRQASLIEGIENKGLPSRLSGRQVEILTLVAQGLTYKEVGAKLFLAERTIKYHMGEIVERLQVHDRGEAIDYARRAGLVA